MSPRTPAFAAVRHDGCVEYAAERSQRLQSPRLQMLTYVLTASVAVTQCAPAILLGLVWPRGNRRGAFAGISAGFALGFYSLAQHAERFIARDTLERERAPGVQLKTGAGKAIIAPVARARPEGRPHRVPHPGKERPGWPSPTRSP